MKMRWSEVLAVVLTLVVLALVLGNKLYEDYQRSPYVTSTRP